MSGFYFMRFCLISGYNFCTLKRILLCLLCFYSMVALAQQPLSQSTTYSALHYIYKITDKEALKIYQQVLKNEDDDYWADEKYLHTLVATYPGPPALPPVLPAGNYVVVYANKNYLEYSFLPVKNVNIKMVSNHHDLALLVHDINGRPLPDAQVTINNRSVPWDARTRTYRISRYNKSGIVKIYYQQVLNVFEVNTPRKIAWWKKLLPKRAPKMQYYRSEPDFYRHLPSEDQYKGFLSFSKAKYKPNDTLRLKAFIVTNNGKPVNEPLLLRLSDERDRDTILTTIMPYRPGGYDFEMVLSEQLDLDLDDNYLLTLEPLSGKKYMLKDNNTDLDDDEFAAKRTVLMRGKFEYEEYELKSVNFTSRTDHKAHTRGMPVSLYLKATDENDLPVMDGRVTITVTSRDIDTYHAPVVFIPATLWEHEVTLEPAGETKVTIPDSIFPAVSFSYNIQSQFLNSNNESQRSSCRQQYEYNTDDISFEQQGDSIAVTFQRSGVSVPGQGQLLLRNEKGDTVAASQVTLPAMIPVHPFVSSYEVSAAGTSKSFSIRNQKANIQCNAARTRDSVFATLANPDNLYFWYSIFAGNKLVAEGYDNKLSWKAASITDKYYFVSLQYIWNDRVTDDQFIVPYLEKQLKVIINSPVAVFPGQTARIGITVSDAEGRPVKDADVTAYAMTAKFNNAGMPEVPYLGKRYRMREAYSTQQISGKQIPGLHEYMSRESWERWKKEMTLDSIEYYRFLHHNGIYTNHEPAPDSITQLAPFIVTNGALRNIASIEIDEQPIYFENTGLKEVYSFPVYAGWHKLECRISDSRIIVDSIYVIQGMKNYISIGTNATDKNVKLEKMPKLLNDDEMLTRRRYLIPFRISGNNDFTYIYQDGKVYWFKNSANQLLQAGPLNSALADYHVKGDFTQRFAVEAGYAFDIQKGLIKEKEMPQSNYRSNLSWESSSPRLYDHVITESAIDSLWKEEQASLSLNRDLFTEKINNQSLSDIVIETDTARDKKDIRQLFLYRYDDPSFIRIYTRGTTRLNNLEAGAYRLLVLLNKNRYYVNDSIIVRENGYTFYRLRAQKVITGDSTSLELGKAILHWRNYNAASIGESVATDFTMPFNNRYLDTATFGRSISGVILDEEGNALPGVSIFLKGTRHGTVTNSHGFFSLSASKNGLLYVSFIGCESQTLSLKDQDYFEIKLKPVTQYLLEDVVVVGYGTTHKKVALTGVISTVTSALAGQVAGISIRGTSGYINTPPLIIIDGIPYEGDLKNLDPALIKEMTVLKDETATALYGARGANGVMLITSTKAGALSAEGMPAAANSLRSNFRDDAFWQPRLRTNEKGEAAFNVTFPDDITSWKTFAIAFTDQGQTGSASTQIKSYKPLSANISLPVFAVAGDSINIIGKVLNYGKDSTTVSRSFYTNNQLVQTSALGVMNSRIDTFSIRVPAGDSVSFKYTINGRNDYFDGEYRAVPVFEQGVKETKGLFAALTTDTSFSVPLAADTGTVHLYASTGVLPVLLDEIDYLQRYEYLCNEQMASKLIGLLLEKQARTYLGQPFKNGKKIAGLIRELEQHKNKDGGWGWWNKSTSVYWVTQHVTSALILAAKEGYTANINKPLLINYYVFQLTTASNTDKITLLETLYELDAKVNFPAYLDTMRIAKNNFHDQLRVLYLKQRGGMSVSTDSLLAQKHTTMMGNSYWGIESYHLFNNSVQLTLLAYKVLRAKGGQEALLRSIRNWFMENRRSGNWRNTYESAAILATIMPDVLKASEQLPATLTVNGQRISSFPYSSTIAAGEPLQISKKGGSSVYFTAWQQHWNPAPQKVSNQFTVSSRFLQRDTGVKQLTAGRAVTMEVVVAVKADADYVMVEIPVPAGCSYNNKNSGWQHNEIHREYFKNKVSIFSNYLTKGIHTFTISLMPRYTGYYHINPAKAEMMYFPVFYGREGMKTVIIGGK
jgi:TonB-dependent SusC/RagA subfamily outer membrane receptor